MSGVLIGFSIIFVVILVRTIGMLSTGQVFSKWGILNREDNPIYYWFEVITGVGILICMSAVCLPDWLVLIGRALRSHR